ncbi:LicD family protein [Bacillus sinesaloumensis]|uniref:LicD family protein n=1 Tax=Litchfieldia sinesaloumensis TaxID=1926280 RepID=UPI00098852EF|nr:LicD family protein [Bacillus sinesaloumensis]
MKQGIDYIKLNEEQLKKLHADLLILLLEVDRICKRYDIQYFLSYGTLIGAIRHNGFIPWDDDIDIQMLRKDYEKFTEVCKSELDTSRFFWQSQKTDINYNWVYGKLRLKNTSYIRAGQEHIKQNDGIFLDILPLDNITSNKFKQALLVFICKVCRKILWSQVGKKNARSLFGKVLYKVLSFIPRKVPILIFEYFAKFDNKKESSFLVSHNTFGQIYKQEWYSKAIWVQYEGHAFRAPIGYDEILSMVYGDYMTLPAVEKRHGHCYASSIKFLDGQKLSLNK